MYATMYHLHQILLESSSQMNQVDSELPLQHRSNSALQTGFFQVCDHPT